MEVEFLAITLVRFLTLHSFINQSLVRPSLIFTGIQHQRLFLVADSAHIIFPHF